MWLLSKFITHFSVQFGNNEENLNLTFMTFMLMDFTEIDNCDGFCQLTLVPVDDYVSVKISKIY